MKQKVMMTVLGIVLVVFIALSVLFPRNAKRVTPVPSSSVGNTAGNAYNEGLFCEYNGKVYFSNPYEDGSIYCMNPDETEAAELIAATASHLCAAGDYLFYFQSQASGKSGLGFVRSKNSVYRATLNGKKITSLYDNLVFHMQLSGNTLFFLTSDEKGPHFMSLGIDGEGLTEIAAESLDFSCAMSDGSIYYAGGSDHYLYRYQTSGGSSSTVLEYRLWYPLYYEGYLYFLDIDNNYRLCRYSFQEDKVELLTHDRVDCYNIAGSRIYYQKNSKTEPALWCMGLDGSEPTKIMDGNYTHINVTSRYVYFQEYGLDRPLYHIPVNGVTASVFSP